MASFGGESEEDGDAEEDVYEVEKIVDWKVEGGKTLYKVRWKGYLSEEDTWEPEGHMKDCKEVLLEFRKKHVDPQPKSVKKDEQKLPFDDDLFEADSEADSDWQSDTKEDLSSNKKKKKFKEREGKSQDEMKKRKSKSVKGKPVLESENSSDSIASDSKPKKRILETKEDTRDSKKHRREDTKDIGKKKGDKDVKKKHPYSEKCSAQSSVLDDAYFQASGSKDVDLDLDSSEVQPRMSPWIDHEEEKSVSSVSVAEKQPDSSLSSDDSFEVKVKRKKKKHKKPEEFKESRKVDAREKYLEKKSTLKKQKAPEKVKASAELECKKSSFATSVQKGSKLNAEDHGHKPVDSSGEGSSHAKLKSKETKAFARDVPQKPTAADSKEKNANWKAAEEKMKDRLSEHTVGESLFEKFHLDTEWSKGGSTVSNKNICKGKQNTEDPTKERSTLSKEKEVRKSEAKDKPQKRYDSEKEEKGRKEQKGFKTLKEIKSAFDAFSISSEEKSEYTDSRKREESVQDFKTTDEFKSKDTPLCKDSRSTRDETDTWAYIAAEGERAMAEDSSDAKQQTVSLGLDMQLEWLSMEDFLKHLDGGNENRMSAEAISAAHLREAVKNGQYATVKAALNSKEEYNLDQEDSSGMTLVMLAAAGGHDDILRLLIRKGAKINCRQKNGTTALIHAAEKNNLTTVAILLEAGACVNLQQNSGETALMKACKRGNYDIVRLMIESGADCNISSKHQNNALHFAKQCNNSLVYDLLKSHLDTLTQVTEKAIGSYFESRLSLVEPVFDLACHRLCEGPDYSLDFTYKPPQNVPEGSGIILFIFHANFFGKEVVVRLCGPCSVHAVVLNDKFQLPIILPHRVWQPSWTEFNTQRILQDSHFIYSFSPIPGLNKLYIRLAEAPTAKVKLLIGAYRVQLK